MLTQQELLVELLREVNRSLGNHIKDTLAGRKIPAAAVVIMRKIMAEPGITVSELARKTGFAKSNVSGVVEELSRQGWVEKRGDPADHRILRLYLTDSARTLLAAIKADIRKRLGSMLSCISENRAAELVECLQEIHQALKQAGRKERD